MTPLRGSAGELTNFHGSDAPCGKPGGVDLCLEAVGLRPS